MERGKMGDYDRLNAVEDTVNKREDKREHMKIEEIINRIMEGSLLKFVAFYLLGLGSKLTAPMMAYLPVFTGQLPYHEWTCLSPQCFSLLSNHTEDNSTFYTRETMCDNDLQSGVDFIWTASRTSFAVDWGLYCKEEGKVAMVKSFYFIGAFLGLIVATTLFDEIGRKKTTIISAAIGIATTVTGAYTNDFNLMLVVRVVQGFGTFTALNGLYVWSIEFTPTQKRTFINLLIGGTLWSTGSAILVMICYFVHDWRHAFLIVSIITFVTSIPMLFYPESPRFHLVKGNEAEAKKILTKVSKIFKRPISFEKIELVYTAHKQNYLDQLKDFLLYPKLRKTTLLLMFVWFVNAALSYGLTFGWHKVTSNIYTAILMAAVSGIVGSFVTYGSNTLIGRKKALIIFLGGVALSFVLAMPNVHLSGDWDLRTMACLLAVVFFKGVWSTIYLITSELAPTSHRGMILSLCSSCARIGAFIGPYMSLIYDVLDQKVVLGIFAGAAACACCAMTLVRDSTGRPIPDTPADLRKENIPSENVKVVKV